MRPVSDFGMQGYPPTPQTYNFVKKQKQGQQPRQTRLKATRFKACSWHYIEL
ncbi:hypothetical protein I79_001567 [Cricetulus griseus]|uniref:Uncharacterized protein n=1 Tax=Cricetulus griseus TaxID=10029 RepID=G3GV36_CRIGR|nr:hypothetical protein I79_001567 [Cricetulus griseus]